MIEFRGVTKRFPDGTVAVDDLDLVAERGKITVFVGPSGCGKTTSLRMINRMIEPTAGELRVDGRDVISADPATLRRGSATSEPGHGQAHDRGADRAERRGSVAFEAVHRHRGEELAGEAGPGLT